MDEQITYNYTLKFNNRVLAFRKKELFDITESPKHIKKTIQGWFINGKLLSPQTAKELTQNNPITKGLTGLQWYQQINLIEVINL